MSELDVVMNTLRQGRANSKPSQENTEDPCTDDVEADTNTVLSRETTGGTVAPPMNVWEGTTTMSGPHWAPAESPIGGGVPLMTLLLCLRSLLQEI